MRTNKARCLQGVHAPRYLQCPSVLFMAATSLSMSSFVVSKDVTKRISPFDSFQ